jgi:hypothetical protein
VVFVVFVLFVVGFGGWGVFVGLCWCWFLGLLLVWVCCVGVGLCGGVVLGVFGVGVVLGWVLLWFVCGVVLWFGLWVVFVGVCVVGLGW